MSPVPRKPEPITDEVEARLEAIRERNDPRRGGEHRCWEDWNDACTALTVIADRAKARAELYPDYRNRPAPKMGP